MPWVRGHYARRPRTRRRYQRSHSQNVIGIVVIAVVVIFLLIWLIANRG
jgi:hypothetical protein